MIVYLGFFWILTSPLEEKEIVKWERQCFSAIAQAARSEDFRFMIILLSYYFKRARILVYN